MSRHDPRKGLPVHLPDGLRIRLVASTDAFLPLSYLARQVLRKALEQGAVPATAVQPGKARPILLQLSATERGRLTKVAETAELSLEVTVLSLLSEHLPD